MWCSDRRNVLIGLAALAGCGFEPAYGPGGAAAGLRGSIRVDDPANRDEFTLVARLEERLGAPAAPRFRLSVSLNVTENSLAITPEQEIERYNLVGRAIWEIRAIGDEAVLARGEEDTFTSYDATGTTVATLASEADAHARLMTALADQIVTRLIATAGDWSG